jgi:hypothetical protein
MARWMLLRAEAVHRGTALASTTERVHESERADARNDGDRRLNHSSDR